MNHSRRTFIQSVGLGGAAAALSGCEAANEALLKLLRPAPNVDFRPPSADQIDLISHLLNRITFGARPGDYRRVEALGVDAFIDEQLHPARIDDALCDIKVMSLETLAETAAEMYEYHHRHLLSDLTRYKLLRGVYSERQLFEVMVDFWTDHLNIVSEKGDCRWLKPADDRDVIRRHALGNFRDLIHASAISAAMLIYLDGHDNKVVRPGDRPNENYARELLELHTLGVHGGYTQQDIVEVARCLSGWTYTNRPLRFKAATVAFNPRRHDDGEKRVLGHVIPAGGGADDLERVLDIVCAHPSTANYLATKLCRRFIADDAPATAVGKVAAAFSRSNGDIKQTLSALFATEDFRQSRGNLFKRPLRFIVSVLRATDASTDCKKPITDALDRMGHAPFQYPTPDGYPIEPQPWLGTLMWRWKFALACQNGRLKGTEINTIQLERRLGGPAKLAAHMLGRKPTDLELQAVSESGAPIAMLTACPAFQYH